MLRSGAQAGDAAGGLRHDRRRLAGPAGGAGRDRRSAAARWRRTTACPHPLLDASRGALRAYARAAADVSDGLVADAGHVAEASGLGLEIDLAGLPLSPKAAAWCAGEADQAQARLALATGGDDYAIVCAVDPGRNAAAS